MDRSGLLLRSTDESYSSPKTSLAVPTFLTGRKCDRPACMAEESAATRPSFGTEGGETFLMDFSIGSCISLRHVEALDLGLPCSASKVSRMGEGGPEPRLSAILVLRMATFGSRTGSFGIVSSLSACECVVLDLDLLARRGGLSSFERRDLST